MEEKFEKVKSWFKKNWVYVVSGAAAASAIALAVVNGMRPDEDVGEPIVIDISKDDWKDQLMSGAYCADQPLTVRQRIAIGDIDSYAWDYLKKNGIITREIDQEISTNFEKDYPGVVKVLNTIEEFWGDNGYPEEEQKGA